MSGFSSWEILLLAILQGLTEFFPVSSSGHLVIVQNLLGIKQPQLLLDIALHLGTLFAVVVFLRVEIVDLIKGIGKFVSSPKKKFRSIQMRLIYYLFLASIPTALIGYFLNDFFESLFGSLKSVSIALIITGLFLFLTKYSQERANIKIIHPFLIGILQGIAIIPGLSRSGLTIGGAMFLGWEREKAAKFSFLLSIPAIIGAFLFELNQVEIHSQPWLLLTLGFIGALISGLLALKYLMKLIKRGFFSSFSFYCIFIGLIAFGLSFII
ncbi:MAG: undecaprenyl-diphosphate phosphatase [Candidatus Aminicenantia bacterium]